MKIKRYKHARKILSFYKTHFHFRTPYQIIVDGTCCQAALTGKIQLKEQLFKYLGGPVQLITTGCILNELKRLGPKLSGAYYIANRHHLRTCGHNKAGMLPAAQCIDSFIGGVNDHHFFVASQDHELRKKLRSRPGIPLFHIIRNTIVLEPPSTATKTKSQQSSLIKIAPSEYEQSVITKLNETLPVQETMRKGRRRRRPGGPNPLSVKKTTKHTVPDRPTGGMVTGSKKRRIRLQRRKAIQQLTQTLAVDNQTPVQDTPT